MNYEEKYKEALEVMRQWIAPCHTKEQLDTLKKSVFPELRESEDEDESTRKALIETVKCIYAGDTMFLSEQQRDRYIDWLEKQLQWKPSEEQINALNSITTIGQLSYAGQGDALISLYQDLKKIF